MTTIEKTPTGYILGILTPLGWEYTPCHSLDDLEIEAYKQGILLQENAPIWHNMYGCNNEQTDAGQ
jgi:hypothetical protein